MHATRPGFTLVELLIVVVLSAVIALAGYEALSVQEQVSRTTSEVVRSQDALRTGFGILESELRELSTMGGTAAGGSDIITATADSVVFRAPRAIGIVCEVLPSDKKFTSWAMGTLFTDTMAVMVFADGDETSTTDDEWVVGNIDVVLSSTAVCLSSPTGIADQVVTLSGASLTTAKLSNVIPGAPVRAWQQVTYGLYDFGDEWGLGRRVGDGPVQEVVSGLAESGVGLVFEYLNSAGATTTDPTQVASIRITAETEPRPRSGTDPVTFTSTVYLRNN